MSIREFLAEQQLLGHYFYSQLRQSGIEQQLFTLLDNHLWHTRKYYLQQRPDALCWLSADDRLYRPDILVWELCVVIGICRCIFFARYKHSGSSDLDLSHSANSDVYDHHACGSSGF